MSKIREYYKAEELKPFEGRPGAMDAFKLPSVMNGVAHPRLAPRIMSATTKIRWVPSSSVR
jgi:hypothetical protein